MHFGIGVWHAKTSVNIGTLFRSAVNFGASYVFTIGRRYHRQMSDTVNAQNRVPLYHYTDLDDLLNHLPKGTPLIGIELDPKSRPLSNFVHPARACYLLGAEDHGLNKETRKRCHMMVHVPYAERCLNVSVAGSIVLYDRINKGSFFKWEKCRESAGKGQSSLHGPLTVGQTN